VIPGEPAAQLHEPLGRILEHTQDRVAFLWRDGDGIELSSTPFEIIPAAEIASGEPSAIRVAMSWRASSGVMGTP
jgi:hypothetical protein